MITYPNAKINLGLNIVEKRPDGYHNLETVFYPINLQDALEVNLLEGEEEFSLKVSGVSIEGEPEDNLVVKAYRLLKKDYPNMPAIDIHMYKHIPTGAGSALPFCCINFNLTASRRGQFAHDSLFSILYSLLSII